MYLVNCLIWASLDARPALMPPAVTCSGSMPKLDRPAPWRALVLTSRMKPFASAIFAATASRFVAAARSLLVCALT